MPRESFTCDASCVEVFPVDCIVGPVELGALRWRLAGASQRDMGCKTRLRQ